MGGLVRSAAWRGGRGHVERREGIGLDKLSVRHAQKSHLCCRRKKSDGGVADKGIRRKRPHEGIYLHR